MSVERKQKQNIEEIKVAVSNIPKEPKMDTLYCSVDYRRCTLYYKYGKYTFCLNLTRGIDGIYNVTLQTLEYEYALLEDSDPALFAKKLKKIFEILKTVNTQCRGFQLNFSGDEYTKGDLETAKKFRATLEKCDFTPI